MDTETQILEAAKKIFLKKGFSGTRMQEIADEANINKSMLHYYFRSKELLFQKIVENSLTLIAPIFLDAITSDGPVMHKLEKLVVTYIDAILKNPHVPMFILYELSQKRVDFIRILQEKLHPADVLPRFIKQIEVEQAMGILKPMDARHLILTVMSLIVFPFIGRPVFQEMLGLSPEVYDDLLEERKKIVMSFLKDSFLQ